MDPPCGHPPGEADFVALAEVCPDLMAIATLDGRMLYLNPAGRALVGLPDDLDVRALRVGDLLPAEALDVAFAEEVPAIVEHGTWKGASTMRDWRGGPPIPVEATTFALAVDGLHGPARFATIRRDVRGELAAAEALDAARHELSAEVARNRAILEHAGDAVVVVGPDGRVAQATGALQRIAGIAPDELVGREAFDLVAKADRVHVAETVATVVATGAVRVLEVGMLGADGRAVPVECVVSRLGGVEGPASVVVAVRDLSERRMAERASASHASALERIAAGRPLHESLDMLARAIEAQLPGMRCSVLLVEDRPSGRVLRHLAAPSLPAAYHEAMDGSPVLWNASACARAVLTGKPFVVEDLATDLEWLPARDIALSVGLQSCCCYPITSPATGAAIGSLTLFSRTTGVPDRLTMTIVERSSNVIGLAVERDAFERRLRHAAQHDPLTGLPNRALLLEVLDEALAPGGPGAVAVFMDLDRLKVVNDSLGHDAGDEVLRHVARRLRAAAPLRATVARFGGDEFVVVDPGCPVELADELAQRLLSAVAEPFEVAGRRLTCTGSAGVVPAPPGRTPAEVLRDADLAMYAAKGEGGHRARQAHPSHHQKAVERLDLEEGLRVALSANHLSLRHQPVVDLLSGRVVGFEALCRWEHPTRGELLPGQFIPLAEESGLIEPLGLWVLAEAVATVQRWRADGARPATISVNVSARQLSTTSLLPAVAMAAEALAPWHLRLELTEGALLLDPEAVRRLTDVGAGAVSLAIDDFGTGYSSLSYLTQLPVSSVKIDRSFVRDLELEGGSSEPIVAAIAGLGETLSLQVVAEGIEEPGQLAALIRLGCPLGQGFLLHRPLHEEAAGALVGARRSA